MPKAAPADFKIHVDPSCLTNPTDSEMSPERTSSNQTIIHHELEDGSNDKKAEESDKQNVEDEGVQERTRAEEARERQLDRIEAQIQAAARAVVASIEEDNFHGEDSVLSMQTDEDYDQEHSQLTYNNGTELTYEDGTELTYDGTEESYETEDESNARDGEGDSSSQHDGDIDDDVFTNSDHSKRSSLNSILEINSSDETQGKQLTSPLVGEEAASQPVSRIPSASSYAAHESTPITPSRVLARPPFRTPSSVRALQMTSPTPSLYSSPRSTKRHLPTVSRIGTPSSPFSKKTPTRFKAKKESPLVLLHVTVLPLSWNYSHAMSAPDLPPALQIVKDNWRLLQGQLGEAVLERGILLPHPQDDYEVLEERLLEALELPVRPRAKILKCGHYMGSETPSSDDEGRDQFFQVDERKWCDICGKDVKLEGSLVESSEKRFRVKIYASNGLMRAGAWAACWREMERVDVELQPFIEGPLAVELEDFAAGIPAILASRYEAEDGFVDEEETEPVIKIEDAEEIQNANQEEEVVQQKIMDEEISMRKKIADEERLREIYGTTSSPTAANGQHKRHQKKPPGYEDSLPELILAAFRVALKDTKNITIVVLSILVILLALKPRGIVIADPSAINPALSKTDVMINTQAVEMPKPMEAPTRAPESETVANSDIASEIIHEQLSDTRIVDSINEVVGHNSGVKQPRQNKRPAERAVPAIQQDGNEPAQSEQLIAPDIIRKEVTPPQAVPVNHKQTAPTLEIDAAKLQADHNDPDLKEVVPVA